MSAGHDVSEIVTAIREEARSDVVGLWAIRWEVKQRPTPFDAYW